MRRYGNLWPSVVSWENLVLAAKKARCGKRDRPAVLRFEFARESELLLLQRELESGSYLPGPFTTHTIQRPKPRLISAAPYRDRVVHHALMNVLEPILDRHFHPDSYACRKGKGTHAASDRLMRLMARNRYTIQCDVRKYFPSVDHALLKDLFRRRIKDTRLLRLMDLIVDSSNAQEEVRDWFPGDDLFTPQQRGRGLPIGNLTSQWFANWYLDGLDHHLTSGFALGGYVRYCDDFLLLDNDKGHLRAALGSSENWLLGRRLRLHSERISLLPATSGRLFVGYRTWPSHRLLPGRNLRSLQRRVRWLKHASAKGAITFGDVCARLAAWQGHASRANCHRLFGYLATSWVFRFGIRPANTQTR